MSSLADAQRALLNAALLDALRLLRFTAGEVRDVLSLLNKADVALMERLRAALERVPSGSFTVRRLDSELRGVWSANDRIYSALADRSESGLRGLVEYELERTNEVFRSVVDGTELPAPRAAPAPAQVWAAAQKSPVRGRLMKEWWGSLGAARARRINDSLRIGFVAGRTVDQMISELRGTRAAGWKDGILNLDRRHVEAVVRTSTAAYAQTAREAYFDANSGLIGAQQWVSTLDSRTTDLCMARDGHRYRMEGGRMEPLDRGSPPWESGPGALHWQCRSVGIPLLIGMEREPRRGQRGASGGPVMASTTFGAWISAQPAEVQREALGPARMALLKAGKVSFKELFDADGRFLTLKQLRAGGALK